ncbi:4Fe-4S dicluster domain-containing protein [Caproiciproducens sp. NJN-50]|uniref:4Fe-4S dicluster domain-containing protein n=1 Tax=Acutalibacteraceae TaxID=3082771 RepID=UPI000FFE1B35|nr:MULTISPECIES: 4Fe-4S dicluster domain-containing protein [Acutalibacteraceae]QAT49830.1 4Fe-4S dicluster domain-containing protein [Caproiciproducens sp. NJN-50]
MKFEYDNEAKQLKFEVLTRVARYAFDGTLEEHLDSIPYEIIPGPLPTFRCCVYREREIIRERMVSARGGNLPGQGDCNVIGVLPAACEGCPISRFRVTDNCQHCLAQKCREACPFGAISITPKGAYIDPQKCRECGRCAAACPYNAISDTLRPCVRSCPVNAIKKDQYKRSVIDYSSCISCGACMKNCPFGAITDRSQILQIIESIKNGTRVAACFAPAAEGHFGKADAGMIKSALKKLGFAEALEVSLGADAVASQEARELREALEAERKMTTSCCPAFVELIEKHYPKLKDLMSHTVSPMTAAARYLRLQNPRTKVVFIGPCVAKKNEIQKVPDTADYVLTFEELAALFTARGIDVEAEPETEQDGSRAGKGFAQSGGVAGAVAQVFQEEKADLPFTCVKCNGAQECKKTLAILNAGRLAENFVEGMACEGGCVAGPAGIEEPMKLKKNRAAILARADQRSISENIQKKHDFSQVKME